MNKEKCGLCGEYSILKKSHLMPKSIYKTISRTFQPYDSAPVWASKSQGSVYYSNAQITKQLLCGTCEDLFNKHGEKYVAGKCMKNAQTFDLKKILDSSCPSVHVKGSSYFHPKDLSKFNSDKFMYFTASIVWRVVATDWGIDDIANLCKALPNQYMEALENYLLKKAVFPKNIFVTVCVDNDAQPVPIMSLPSGNIERNKHLSFFIPGIKFNVFFGMEADRELSSTLSKLGINIIYMYRSFRESDEFQQMTSQLSSEFIPKGKLKKQMSRT